MKQITKFWNWFLNNEETIKNALWLAINTEEVFQQLDRQLEFVSKRIGYIIVGPSNSREKYTLIFTGHGYRKLFAKIEALHAQAPALDYFVPQAFIKPIQDTTRYRQGTDEPLILTNGALKISQTFFALDDFNTNTKQLKIKLHVANYNEIKDCEETFSDLLFVVAVVIGEVAFQRHIKSVRFTQLSENTTGLEPLINLQDYINYLYKITARGKTRAI